MAPRKLYSVGLVGKSQSRMKRFWTAEEADAFISTLPGHEDGRYYLDGPDLPVVLTEDEKVRRLPVNPAYTDH